MHIAVYVISFLCGIAVQSVIPLNAYGICSCTLVSLVSFFIFLFHRSDVFGLFVVCLLLFSLGVLRAELAFLSDAEKRNAYPIGNIITTAIVVDEPDERERSTRLTVKLGMQDGTWSDAKVLVVLDRYPAFSYGDVVRLSGKLSRPENFSEHGRLVNYIRYLEKDGVFYEMVFPRIKLISSGNGNPVQALLYFAKHSFIQETEKLISEPGSSLLGGLVVGAKHALGADLTEQFRRTGLVHVVVLSGYNVTIVAETIMRVLSFLPQVVSLSLGALSIVLFALMTGGSATVVRASIMALLVLLARATGRRSDIMRALMLAALLMVLVNPRILIFDPSFQLSFLASLGLIELAPRIERFLRFVPTHLQLREVAVATISTQLFVLPLLLYSTGQFSLVALPANLLVLVTIPLTMLLGFLTGMIAFLSSALALPFAVITDLLLSYQLMVVSYLSRLPFSAIEVPPFSVWVVAGVYGCFTILLVRWRYGNVTRQAV
jgi:competence protein ComEC